MTEMNIAIMKVILLYLHSSIHFRTLIHMYILMYIIPAETSASEAAASEAAAPEETCLLFLDKGTLVKAPGWETAETVQNVPEKFSQVFCC